MCGLTQVVADRAAHGEYAGLEAKFVLGECNSKSQNARRLNKSLGGKAQDKYFNERLGVIFYGTVDYPRGFGSP